MAPCGTRNSGRCGPRRQVIDIAEQKPAVRGRFFYACFPRSKADRITVEARNRACAGCDNAQRARTRYACFDHLAEDPQQCGYATTFGMKQDCEVEVMRQLMGMTANLERYAGIDGVTGFDEAFYAQQNARVAQNAESYYRAMFEGRNASWNVRDTHMADTLDVLRENLSRRRGDEARMVVWAHNSHIGDARATEMGRHGELNLGQLVRQRHGDAHCFLLGYTTHAGTVTAASKWDHPPERKNVRPSLEESVETLMHRAGHDFFAAARQSWAAAATGPAARASDRRGLPARIYPTDI